MIHPPLSFQRKLESHFRDVKIVETSRSQIKSGMTRRGKVWIKLQISLLSHGERIEVRGYDVETVDINIETAYPLTALLRTSPQRRG